MDERLNGRMKEWGVKACLLISMFFTVLYLMWRIFFTIPYEYGIVPILASGLLLVIEILGTIESFAHYKNVYRVEEYPLPEVPKNKFPHVDIFVSTYTESVELLKKTLLACKRMEYPNKDKVHIYLCDDGHREEMGVLAAELGVNYLIRDTHEGAKAGNLNHALANSSSPYVVTFDADMMPQSNFLMNTIPYFVDAELKNRMLPEKDRIELGFIQTPQSFYDLDLYQYHLYSEDRIPNEQDYFYRYIQVARTHSNSVIYGGSNTVLSRKALNAVGGFYTDAITEDFATGILIEKKGFVSLGTGRALASGMNPHSLPSLIQQRVRWARGVIATGRKMHILLSPELTAAQKINYWSSVWYWYSPVKRLVYILLPILSAILGAATMRFSLLYGLMFWLPMYMFSRISQSILSYNTRTSKWTGIYEASLFPFLLMPVLLEFLGISLRKFKVTNKTRKTEKANRPVYMIPFIILILLSLAGIANCIRAILINGTFGPAILLPWLVSNMFLLTMSLFFVSGRRADSVSERIRIQVPGVLHAGGQDYECVTCDMSETEISLDVKQPYPIQNGETVRMDLETDKYRAALGLKMLCSEQRRRKRETVFHYTFAVTDYMESYDPLLAILYDRPPAHPDRIALDGGSLEDLRLNFWRRITSRRRRK